MVPLNQATSHSGGIKRIALPTKLSWVSRAGGLVAPLIATAAAPFVCPAGFAPAPVMQQASRQARPFRTNEKGTATCTSFATLASSSPLSSSSSSSAYPLSFLMVATSDDHSTPEESPSPSRALAMLPPALSLLGSPPLLLSPVGRRLRTIQPVDARAVAFFLLAPTEVVAVVAPAMELELELELGGELKLAPERIAVAVAAPATNASRALTVAASMTTGASPCRHRDDGRAAGNGAEFSTDHRATPQEPVRNLNPP